MPQMSPMWWTLMMLMFSTLFITSMAMNYFMYSKSNKSKNIFKKKNMNWMW